MSWLIVILGYLIGCIPTAYIAGRITTGGDIRKMGDGNMGAANAYRILGTGTGLLVFFFDLGKGCLAVFIARQANIPEIAVLITGFAVVAGHNWPVFLGFRGGRGESTAIGVLLVLFTVPAIIALILALISLALWKNVLLSSAVGFVPLSLLGWLFHYPGILIAYSVALPCLLGLTHLLRTRKQIAHG
jgi:acyl phosphate:glycerol-3-phosphate acyltransferase